MNVSEQQKPRQAVLISSYVAAFVATSTLRVNLVGEIRQQLV